MIYLIIGVIAFTIWFYFMTESFGDALLGSIIGLFAGTLACLIIGTVIGGFLPVKEVVEEKPLYALTDTTSIQGSKYLFSGYIEDKLTYRYIIDTERGKHLEEINTTNVYINEGDYDPHVKIYNTELAKDWYYWFANNLVYDTTYYEFYVPKNTLIHNYQVDLE